MSKPALLKRIELALEEADSHKDTCHIEGLAFAVLALLREGPTIEIGLTCKAHECGSCEFACGGKGTYRLIGPLGEVDDE
jgi:hypothetical protein